MKTITKIGLRVAFLSFLWWAVILATSFFSVAGTQRNWLISFGNSILNATAVGLLVVLVLEVMDLRKQLREHCKQEGEK